MLKLLVFLAAAGTTAAAELAFSRITPGWPNYSTGFNTTHDPGPNGEFATVGTFYTPPYTAKLIEFATIAIWSGEPPEIIEFSEFTFSICVWSSLELFIRDPRAGDVLNQDFAQPTAISQDGVTRGGRPTYNLRFALTNSPAVLTNCRTYLLGMIARADSTRSGELYVPTAAPEGPSDVQAGNIVPFSWQYLIDAGGATVYSGQAATELMVEPISEPPRLRIAQSNSMVRLSWEAWASCYRLESADALGGPWQVITNEPDVGAEAYSLALPSTNSFQFFRLAR